MTTRIPLVRPALGDAEVDAAERVIRSGWVTQGPEVAAFENEFAAAVGAEHAVAVSNCTVALQLALLSAGVKAGDEVITVSHSFIATANAIIACSALPVFIDVERDTLGMDPALLEAAITPKTRAILCVHQIGIPCDIRGIVDVAVRYGVAVVEDAACAIGSQIQWDGAWERIGRPRGSVACFSLHPRKIVTTGDGGILTTNDAELASRYRLLRQHAMTLPDTLRHRSTEIVFEDYVEPAFNFRLTDLQAAIGRPQLARLDAIVAERRRLADRYHEAFADHPLFAPPGEREWARSNWQSYPVFLRGDMGQVDALRVLMNAGVACKRGISNAHQEIAYAARPKVWKRGSGLVVSEWLRENTILLPLFHGMTAEEQERVIEACYASKA